MKPEIISFFDEATNTISYVVADPLAKKCAVVDPLLDFDSAAGRITTQSADKIVDCITQKGYQIEWILETHAHADHISACAYLREKLGGKTAIGKYISNTQEVFSKIFNLGPGFPTDGSQFDHLFDDGEEFSIGDITAKALHTPGHTPACITYVVGDAAFVGDTLFMPDFGSARTDFPGGDAAVLYQSVQKIYSMPPETRLFMCHDYKAPGRDEFAWETTVEEQRKNNIHIRDGVSADDFVEMREARDANLGMPKLVLPSIQINIRAGQYPTAEDNGVSYLKLPINIL